MTPAALRFTYRDYLLLPEDRRYELIDGDLYRTPSPNTRHQRLVGGLYRFLDAHVRGQRLGEVFLAPYDVILSDTDVVQPDLLFVHQDRLGIVGDKNLTGPPDLVVEILSPATADRDRTLKAKLYSRSGVGELWIVDPDAKTVEVLRNAPEGFRRIALFSAADTLASPSFPTLALPLAEVFSR